MNERTIRAEMLLGAEAMKKLKNAHVAVFGLGGVGSWCAEALARSGVGHLTLIDQDTVGLSNINRQLCALSSTVDMPKAEVLRRRIKDIDPDIDVRTIVGRYEAADRENFFTDYDYIVDCIDLVSCKVDLIRTAKERGIPIVSALGTGNKRDAQKLMLCDIKKTSGCPLARVVRRELSKIGIEHHDVVFSPEEAMEPEQFEAPPPGRRSVPGSLVWVPASAGLLLCQHVVTAIAGLN
jgi:tRNA threonylcarbamoyladenosine dehydratase